MAENFTTQNIIDILSELYDERGFYRGDIWMIIEAFKHNGFKDLDIKRIYDLVVG